MSFPTEDQLVLWHQEGAVIYKNSQNQPYAQVEGGVVTLIGPSNYQAKAEISSYQSKEENFSSLDEALKFIKKFLED